MNKFLIAVAVVVGLVFGVAALHCPCITGSCHNSACCTHGGCCVEGCDHNCHCCCHTKGKCDHTKGKCDHTKGKCDHKYCKICVRIQKSDDAKEKK